MVSDLDIILAGIFLVLNGYVFYVFYIGQKKTKKQGAFIAVYIGLLLAFGALYDEQKREMVMSGNAGMITASFLPPLILILVGFYYFIRY